MSAQSSLAVGTASRAQQRTGQPERRIFEALSTPPPPQYCSIWPQARRRRPHFRLSRGLSTEFIAMLAKLTLRNLHFPSRVALATCLLVAACDGDEGAGSQSSEDRSNESASSPMLTTEVASLRAWLTQGSEYRSWASESSVHPSAGPHFGQVRTYLNPALLGSLTQAASNHPAGSAAVKELYGSGGEVQGWSVMYKPAAGEGGAAWFWYEEYAGSTYASGFGSGGCVGCHAIGQDHVRTPFPLQ